MHAHRSTPLAVAIALAAAGAAVQASAEPLAAFSGGIGSQPFASVNGAPAPNDINGVLPGGRPWLIGRLGARIETDGSVVVKGKGLVLAGGATVGTAATPRQVFATLYCNGSTSGSDSPAVDLAQNGDFTIRGTLSPMPPSPCASPVLLIRNNAGAGAWFAAGIPGSGDDE